jgi:Ca2+-binding EF-hand superfamily protein
LSYRLSVPSAFAAALILAGLSACAGDPTPAAARGPRATTFLSPAGKPFHAETGQPYPVAAWFAEADANHDGKLTKDEFRADFARFFNALDQDHNGVIDGVELQRYEQQVAPEVLPRLAQVQGGFPGERGGPADRRLAEQSRARAAAFDGAAAYSLLNVSEPVAGADTDFDGRITLEEFQRMADRRFDLLDKNKDGYLTLDTLPQTPEQMAVEGRKRR